MRHLHPVLNLVRVALCFLLASGILMSGGLGLAAQRGALAPTGTGAAALSQADALYDDGEFDAAALRYREFLERKGQIDPAMQIHAWERLGIAQALTGREDQAREAFSQLLELDHGHRLDELRVIPEVIQLYEQVRNDYLQRQPLPDLRATQPFAYSLIPFGAAQYFNDESGKALALLGGEVGAIGLSVFSYTRKKDSCRAYEGGVCLSDDEASHRRWETAQKTAAFVAAGLFIYGFVDGILFYREKETPIAFVPIETTPEAIAAGFQVTW